MNNAQNAMTFFKTTVWLFLPVIQESTWRDLIGISPMVDMLQEESYRIYSSCGRSISDPVFLDIVRITLKSHS